MVHDANTKLTDRLGATVFLPVKRISWTDCTNSCLNSW